ncbi:hypothetical protein XI09_07900, partial [Bradyrhizobium sp. CCBAU 11386]
LAIEPFAVGNRLTAAGRGRNDRLSALLGEELSQTVGVVGFVGDQPLDRSGCRKKGWCQRDIVDVTWREQQDAGTSLVIGYGVDFRRPATARTADGLPEVPPFPPAADRCALMWELSIATDPTMPVLPVKASNISNQSPCRLQRLNRL